MAQKNVGIQKCQMTTADGLEDALYSIYEDDKLLELSYLSLKELNALHQLLTNCIERENRINAFLEKEDKSE